MKSGLLFILFIGSSVFLLQCKDFKKSSHTKQMIREVSEIIKSKSLFSDSLRWNQIDDSLSVLPFGKNDSSNNELIFDFFINQLRNAGDKHSFFLTKEQIKIFVKKNPEFKKPEGKYLGDGIGLIKVPHYSFLASPNITRKDFANSIRYQIKMIDTQNEIKSWVIDLRGNTGGDMWPMLGGLNALINDGIVGYFVGKKDKKDNAWESKNGEIQYPLEFIDTYKVKKTPNKIALLIDSLTASSGEMTAISLIGLANVRIFGQPSAGYITANATIILTDGTQLNLAMLNVADRTHKLYSEKIIPDVIVERQSSLVTDETLETSMKWLLKTDKR